MLTGKNIVVGVTGGIAVYKAVDVISKLKKMGANIDVIMTKSAKEFVTPLTFSSISQNRVIVDMFEQPVEWDIEHISLAKKADLFLIVPATANIIGKVANGIADDMLTTTIMATTSKVIFGPAMNTNMYNNTIFNENVNKLRENGYEFIDADSGRLACGDYGAGKLPQPEIIVDYVKDFFERAQDLKDKTFIITAGPTIEPLDPVRYLTNYSSGKMGYAIAKEASRRGAKVTLVTGPTNLDIPQGVEAIRVNTTREMLEAIKLRFKECDVLVKAAAPLDYRPDIVSDHKIKKDENTLKMSFVKNPDIAYEFGKIKGNKIIIGFAAETKDVIENATRKIKKKNFDFIVANNVAEQDAGFRGDTNVVTILDGKDNIEEHPKMSKDQLSGVIVDKITTLIQRRGIDK
ncbi:bifunctional phosphopantothenoylcysteine decarboxylase/phosphopantothenate--cysteine ligase CoaBC [Clostridiisalibacter paucivorans]|uniref:bifunctional phosphopantothenoylcysteine decarboxylase/phosphopantothenate--cysteine ligase CoaBC n=1 Tax=Clostridiisalibacter paucivorans TaxID=408753 RepID=UPI00047D94FF|nr:bifunctional phosphopantothenoylcysteine decarboxylase/phosphopantothenate--cysteine ligase CoaBC [Clostridiisalibacter paucivorans]